ncbi:Hypothetical predicted protein [Octopus vulgaris]|uniref:Uncharacterized protein n=1 Tax=Octopus vulgaris TaxID=6645 RepID=A0AA36BDH7_OCTVU|nr:Hypothetical predicted protein [Octopus vulgaris]
MPTQLPEKGINLTPSHKDQEEFTISLSSNVPQQVLVLVKVLHSGFKDSFVGLLGHVLNITQSHLQGYVYRVENISAVIMSKTSDLTVD